MLTPSKFQAEISKHHDQMYALLKDNPWLIPATLSMQVIPVALGVHGFWKNRQLSKQLKIERERTKQLALQQVENVTTKVKTATEQTHCPTFIHDHLCKHFTH
ncbi:transposase [Lactiplantibacillus daowaiensis]|uniref:Transposase n=1 Tax=Lactiplantibacillus daowaiensis TaxID=2559918 RepID=A0ABW1S040_9LACO|nr:transposase [Lactiplantibacillus daowaiensis]